MILYTAMLPGAILVWRALLANLGRAFAEGAPALLVIIGAFAITLFGLYRRINLSKRQLLAIILAVAMGLWVFFSASMASKRIHLPEYVLLAFLVNAAFNASGGLRQQLLWVTLSCALLGITDEILQGLIPSRYFSYNDMLANAGAGLAGALLAYGLRLWPTQPIVTRVMSRASAMATINLLVLGLCVGTVQEQLLDKGSEHGQLPMSLALLVALWLSVSCILMLRNGVKEGELGPRTVFIISTCALSLLLANVLLQFPFR